MSPEIARIRWASLVTVIGAVIGMLGDYCLLYTPQGGYMAGDYAFLAGIGNDRLLWGHYLGILGIPLECGIFYLVWRALQPLGTKWAAAGVFAGLYIMFLGVAYHGGVYPLADAVRRADGTMEIYRAFNEPLGLAFAGVFFVLVTAMTVVILRGRTAFPKSYALATPLVSYGLIMVLYLVWPAVGNLLAPLGFNFSIAVFAGFLGFRAAQWAT